MDFKSAIVYKLIDYYFDVAVLVDLPHHKYKDILGVLPTMNDQNNIPWNEFFYPLFLSGNLLYSNYLDKLTALSYTDILEMEALSAMIGIGYELNDFNPAGVDFNIKKLPRKKANTYYLSLDVPECYYDKEYFNLFNDVLSLEYPLLPLGLYIEKPLNLIEEKNHTNTNFTNLLHKVNKNDKINTNNDLDMDEIVQEKINRNHFNTKFQIFIESLKKFSSNNKSIFESVQLDLLHLPLFITNPTPGFTLGPYMKLMVLVPMEYYKEDTRGYNSSSNLMFSHRNSAREKMTTKSNLINKDINLTNNNVDPIEKIGDKIVSIMYALNKMIKKSKEK